MRIQPRALVRLVEARNRLYQLAHDPKLGRGDHIPAGRHRTHTPRRDREADCADEPLVPDPTGEQVVRNPWQRVLARADRRIEDLARDLEAELTGQDDRPEKWRCTCGAWGRAVAQYCERCGKARNADSEPPTSQKVRPA